VSFGLKMVVLSTINVASLLLCLDVKASGSSIPSLNVQEFLAVLCPPMTHAVGNPVLLTSTVLYPVGELSKNF